MPNRLSDPVPEYWRAGSANVFRHGFRGGYSDDTVPGLDGFSRTEIAPKQDAGAFEVTPSLASESVTLAQSAIGKNKQHQPHRVVNPFKRLESKLPPSAARPTGTNDMSIPSWHGSAHERMARSGLVHELPAVRSHANGFTRTVVRKTEE